MKSEFISLNKAAFLVNKSTQTIRRLIKKNKVKFRRKRTAQGFIYFIEHNSLIEFFNFRLKTKLNLTSPNQMTNLDNHQSNLDKTALLSSALVSPEKEDPSLYDKELTKIENDLSNLTKIPIDHQTILKSSNEGQNESLVLENVSIQNKEQTEKEMSTTQTEQIITQLISQNQKLIETKDQEIRRNYELITQMQEQLNSLFRIMENLQAGYQRLLNPPKSWWHFWK